MVFQFDEKTAKRAKKTKVRNGIRADFFKGVPIEQVDEYHVILPQTSAHKNHHVDQVKYVFLSHQCISEHLKFVVFLCTAIPVRVPNTTMYSPLYHQATFYTTKVPSL